MTSLYEVLNMQIEELEFSVRTYNCLKRAGLDTVGKLCEITEDELYEIRNMSKTGVSEVSKKMWGLGLYLKGVDKSNFDINSTKYTKDNNFEKEYCEDKVIEFLCTETNCEFRKVCSLNKKYCVKDCFDIVLHTLTPKEEKIIKLYYGINCEKRKTCLEIGEELYITREHVMKIKSKILRKLRHKSRSKYIKALLPTIFAVSKETPYSRLAKKIFEFDGSNSELFRTEILYPLQKQSIEETEINELHS